jgi:hypothetical protein
MRTIDFVAKELGRRRAKSIAGILCMLLGIGIFGATPRDDGKEGVSGYDPDKPG